MERSCSHCEQARCCSRLAESGRRRRPHRPRSTVLSAEGRRALPTRLIGGQEMFALDDLARLFNLTVREDAAAGGLDRHRRAAQTIVLSPARALASVGGRLISLPAPPVARRTRLVRAGRLRPARSRRSLDDCASSCANRRACCSSATCACRASPGASSTLGARSRLTLDVAPPTPHAITQDGNRLLVRSTPTRSTRPLPAASRRPT